MKSLLKPFLYVLGLVSLVAGVIGIFIPLLPTTPFLLLSAFCFSKSSERFHQMIYKVPVFGQYLVAWESARIIPRRAKVLATVLLSSTYCILLYRKLPIHVLIPVGLLFIGVLVFLWKARSEAKQI